jgi:hypothetical protein
MPSNALGLATWLEADRMRSLTITPETLTAEKLPRRSEQPARVPPAAPSPHFSNNDLSDASARSHPTLMIS